eukprot:1146365-Pelagomonas_calceolata.AAC.5
MGHYLQHLMGGKYQELRTDVCAQEEGSGGKSRALCPVCSDVQGNCLPGPDGTGSSSVCLSHLGKGREGKGCHT